jgi:hypothetical protein
MKLQSQTVMKFTVVVVVAVVVVAGTFDAHY